MTILAWLLMAHFAVQAAEQLAAEGIDAEVIDVRSLSPIDYETIGESVKKTGRVVIVEEGPKTGGVSAEIAAGIMERFPEACWRRSSAWHRPDVPVPFTPGPGKRLPARCATIIEAVRKAMKSSDGCRLTDEVESFGQGFV